MTAPTVVVRRGSDWADSLPAVRPVSPEDVQAALVGAPRLVVLDDDPTGTQTVRDVPVLTRWKVGDIVWALEQGGPGFYILTNTRSLTPEDAASRNREIVRACLAAAGRAGVDLVFASRGDSTLRGHFPLETDVLSQELAAAGAPVDAIVLSPAYLDAGRVTLDGIHWVRSAEGLMPVAEGEFARDATFGYRSSRLSEWVEEKSKGAIPAGSVHELRIESIRNADTAALDRELQHPKTGEIIVLDALEDDDLRAAVLAALGGESFDSVLLYRVGPSFVRARLGQGAGAVIPNESLSALIGTDTGGLVVVGSHVGVTARQLLRLKDRHDYTAIELDVATVIDPARVDGHLNEIVTDAQLGLRKGLVVLSTSRQLVTGADAEESLAISRAVSAALTSATKRIVAQVRPAFVVAKGGITSSDIATDALEIDRAWARGSLLPGIVSLWEAASGPANGLPYVVFAGNVGDDESLADVIERLEKS